MKKSVAVTFALTASLNINRDGWIASAEDRASNTVAQAVLHVDSRAMRIVAHLHVKINVDNPLL